MKIRYPLTMKAAEKRNKFEYVELLNSDFFEGHVKIASDLIELQQELSLLQWDEKRKKEDPRYENHLCDALLYAWRESGHWGYRKPEPEVELYSKEWEAAEIKRIEDQLRKEKEGTAWWEK